MSSKKDKNKNPYAGWTDPALNDPSLERTLNRFIPSGFGKPNLVEETEQTAARSEQQATSPATAQNTNQPLTELVTQPPPLAPPLAPPLVPPLIKQAEITSAAPLDATHTMSEQKVYSVMYRLAISQGKRERYFTNKELLQATGIRSPYTVRVAIDGLEAKRSIEVILKATNGNNYGDRYRIYTPKEIFARRREIGIEIDPQTKRIIPPLAPPLAPHPKIRGGPIQKLEGALNKIENNFKKDDDPRACAREVHQSLRSFFPTATEEEIQRACLEIDQLIAEEIKKRAAHASTSPVSPQYFVECIRRLCSASQRQPTASKRSTSRNAHKRKIEALAAQLRSLHTGSTYTLADLSADLKAACIREGLEYDADLITEVITRR